MFYTESQPANMSTGLSSKPAPASELTAYQRSCPQAVSAGAQSVGVPKQSIKMREIRQPTIESYFHNRSIGGDELMGTELHASRINDVAGRAAQPASRGSSKVRRSAAG